MHTCPVFLFAVADNVSNTLLNQANYIFASAFTCEFSLSVTLCFENSGRLMSLVDYSNQCAVFLISSCTKLLVNEAV